MPAEEAHTSLESSQAVELCPVSAALASIFGGEMEALPALGGKIQAVLDARRALVDVHAPHTQTEPAQRKHRPRLSSVAEISEVQDAGAGRNSPSRRISAATTETNGDTHSKMVQDAEAGGSQQQLLPSRISAAETNSDTKMVRSSETHDGEFEVTVQGLQTTGTWKWRDAVRGCLNLATRPPCFHTSTEIDDHVSRGGGGGSGDVVVEVLEVMPPKMLARASDSGHSKIDVLHPASAHWRVGPFVKELERYERTTAEERTRKKRDAFCGCLIAAFFLVLVIVAVGLLWSGVVNL